MLKMLRKLASHLEIIFLTSSKINNILCFKNVRNCGWVKISGIKRKAHTEVLRFLLWANLTSLDLNLLIH